jgi:hypothetical protein
MQKIRTSEIARTRCCTDQTLCGLKIVAEGWKFPSCQSQKDRVHPNSAFFGAPEVLCGTIEFRGGVEFELTQKNNSTRRLVHAARKCRAGHQPEAIL